MDGDAPNEAAGATEGGDAATADGSSRDGAVTIASLLRTLPQERREAFRRRLAALGQRPRSRAALEAEIREAVAERRAREAMPLRLDPPDDLPIAAEWERLQSLLQRHRAVVVEGATGSGKSTQLPRLCAAMGRGIEGRIVVTEPRRLAARAIARRLAESCGTPLGAGVGYRTRFERQVSAGTRIEVVTDGVLAAMLRRDRLLRGFDTVILDEAHERSVTIDLLLGAMRTALRSRRDLRVIVTSATLAAGPLAAFLGEAPVVSIAGRQHPVEIRHRPLDADAEGDDPEAAMLDAAGDAVAGLLAEIDPPEGDLLVFLPGERQIRELAEHLEGRVPGGVELLPLHARLDPATQDRAFARPAGLRVILATNVAETSLTLPWVRGVVDTGLARVARFDPRRRVQRLRIEAISRASAAQRAGRCGRVGPGICVRLYGEEDLDRRSEFTPPELLRCGLAGVMLQLSHLRLGAIERFPFPDPPSPSRIAEGRRSLWEIGAIEASVSEEGGSPRDRLQLTAIGRRLAAMPLDPRLARVVLGGLEEDCLPAATVVAAFLSVQDPRTPPRSRAGEESPEASAARGDPFRDGRSDFLSILRLWEAWRSRGGESRRAAAAWCRRHGLHPARMREWSEVHRQLQELLHRRWRIRRDESTGPPIALADPARLHRAALRGLVGLVAAKEAEEAAPRDSRMRPRRGAAPPEGEYLSADGVRLSIWPGSVLAKQAPSLLLAGEIVETQRRWVRTVAPIRSSWIERVAPHLLQRERFEPHFLAESGQVAAWERVRLGAITIVPRRRVPFGPVDPAAARQVFISAGLVEERWRTRGSFRRRNRRLLDRIEAVEARTRRPAAILREGAIYAFYDARLPAEIHSGPAFESWRRNAERRDPAVLRMAIEDLAAEFEWPDPAAYPDALLLEGEGPPLRLPLRYRHEPGGEQDGVVIELPIEAIERFERLAPPRLPWLVPGLLPEKVLATIRGLPKATRIRLGVAREAAREAVDAMRFGSGGFASSLAAVLARRAGEAIPPAMVAEAASRCESHLRFGIELVDREGNRLDFRRDGGSWSRRWGEEARRRIGEQGPDAAADPEIDRWSLGPIDALPESPIPREVIVRSRGVAIAMHPAIEPAEGGDRIALRLRSDPDEADAVTGEALVSLFAREAREAILHHLDYHPLAALLADAWPDRGTRSRLARLVAARCFDPDPASIRSRGAFEQRLEQRLPRLFEVVDRTLGAIADASRRAASLRESLREPAPQAWRPAIAAIEAELDRQLGAGGRLPAWPPASIDRLAATVESLRRRFGRLRAGLPKSESEAIGRLEDWRSSLAALPLHPADRRRLALLEGLEQRSIAVSAPDLTPPGTPSEASLARAIDSLLAAAAPSADRPHS